VSKPTALDTAHARMQAEPENTEARLRFYECLAATELFLLLQREADERRIEPCTIEADGASFVLVFDREERLADFAGGPAPYAVLSGRSASEMLASERLGIGLNTEVAPSSILLPPDAVAWLAELLGDVPQRTEALPRELRAPAGLSDGFLSALDARLASAAGLARRAHLAGVIYDDGTQGYLLAFTDAVPGAETALARAAADVMRFSDGVDAVFDVAFFRSDDPALSRLARAGLRFDLPEPGTKPSRPAAPGMDPDAPPRLK